MAIISNLQTVIERQKAYNVYRPEEFLYTPYNTAYWSGHLIEELLELMDTRWGSPEAAEEAADCIIFLQNLMGYLFPNTDFVFDLKDYHKPENLYYSQLLLAVRKIGINRKTWKIYPEDLNAVTEVIDLIFGFLLLTNNAETITSAYYVKEERNKTRIDWIREVPIIAKRDINHNGVVNY